MEESPKAISATGPTLTDRQSRAFQLSATQPTTCATTIIQDPLLENKLKPVAAVEAEDSEDQTLVQSSKFNPGTVISGHSQ